MPKLIFPVDAHGPLRVSLGVRGLPEAVPLAERPGRAPAAAPRREALRLRHLRKHLRHALRVQGAHEVTFG